MKKFHSNTTKQVVWFDPKDVISMTRHPKEVLAGREPTLFTRGLEGMEFPAFTKVTLKNKQQFHVLETPEEIMGDTSSRKC